jgi:hypothetical protein
MSKTTSVLAKRAMLVTLSISQPRLTVTDKEVTKKVLNDHGAERNAAKVIKNLFGKDYVPIKQKINVIRAQHYHMTSPWLDSGARVIATPNFETYSKFMREQFDELDQLVDDFVRNYEDVLNRQATVQNGLFRKSDYPHPAEIRSEFGHKVHFAPVPTADDFRAEIDEFDLDYIKADLMEREEQAIDTIMDDAYQRLFDVVSHVSAKLNEPKAIFRDTLIGNVKDLLDIMDGLNVRNDPLLTGLAKDVEARIASADCQALRKDESFRKDVAKEADDIVNRMSALFG